MKFLVKAELIRNRALDFSSLILYSEECSILLMYTICIKENLEVPKSDYVAVKVNAR